MTGGKNDGIKKQKAKPVVLPDDAPHVLVIDDDRRIRELLSRYLSEHGYRITTADSAFSAESHMKGLAFDLLILDVMMPGRSGTDFARIDFVVIEILFSQGAVLVA